MRVLVAGTPGPSLPDGAWPAPHDDPPGPADGPSPRDVGRWWSAAGGAGGTATNAAVLVEVVALASAGPGFLDALTDVAPEVLAGVVPGAGGADVPVAMRRDARTGTVYADASQVPAHHAVHDAVPDAVPDVASGVVPDRASGVGHAAPPAPRSSAGLGHLLALCADAARTAEGRAGRVVLATGGARSHDAGAGLLRALAGPPGDGVERTLADVLRAARVALRGAHLVAAVATDAPLLGLHGASAALPAHGVDDVVAQDLERALGAVAHDVAAAVETLDRGPAVAPGLVGRDLLGASSSRRLARLPGAGSGGGTGFAVAALGGRIVPALRVLADDVGLDARLAGSDLAVVVTDELGAHELGDGAVREVARRAAAHAVPVVVVARSVVAGRREQASAGLSGAYAWGDGSPQELVARVARTWSRP